MILKSNCRDLVMFINSKVNSSGDNSMSVGHITKPVMSKSCSESSSLSFLVMSRIVMPKHTTNQN